MRSTAPRRLLLTVALLLLLAGVSAASGKGEILILAPPDLEDASRALASHRRDTGHEARVRVLSPGGDRSLSPEDVKAAVRGDFERSAGRLRFLVLMGDAPSPADPPGLVRLPPRILEAKFDSARWPHPESYASDTWYGMLDGSGMPSLAVGRLPADGPEEAGAMVGRILAYEKSADFGAWRKTLNVVAGQGGFGPMVDAFIESTFKKYLAELLDKAYDVTLTYANPRSPYCFPPPGLSGKVAERINAGSLVTAYVGHGQPHGFDRLKWEGRTLPIFDLSDVERVRVARGAPVVVVIACSTGHFDHARKDCISEALMKRAKGPVAVFSSTRISHPYPNAILGRALVKNLMSPGHPTIGEAILGVKRALIRPEGKEQAVVDRFAAFMMKPSSLEPCREDHVHLYNLLGDPAMPLGHPGGRVRLEAPGEAAPGETIEVRGVLETALEGKAVVTLEAGRGVILKALTPLTGLQGRALEEAMEANWARANDLEAARGTASVEGKRFRVRIAVPAEGLPPGAYVIKAFVEGRTACALGSLPIRLGEGGGGEAEEEEEEGF